MENKLTVEHLFGKIEFWQTLKKKPAKQKINLKAIERFYRKLEIDFSTGCWNFCGHISKKGYGKFSLSSNKCMLAHKFLWEFFHGRVPENLELDHAICQNRRCCNPSHLEPVTHIENMRRARKKFCHKGHSLLDENLYVSPRGHRRCRACILEYAKLRNRRYQEDPEQRERLRLKQNEAAKNRRAAKRAAIGN
jgi:hypothetical protein